MIFPPNTKHNKPDFMTFLTRAFETLHPTKSMIANWHLDLICSYLHSITTQDITRMIFNLPPRALKSITINVAWTAWLLGVAPDLRIITISYNQELSNKHAKDCRLIMQSDWYRKLFPNTVIARGFNKINKFCTTQGGFRLSTSPNGTLLGEGADLIIVDDPISAVDILSNKKRQKLNHWFNSSLMSRLNDTNNGRIVIVMQRLHREDLTGFLLAQQNSWQKLVIPAISEQDEVINFRKFRYVREKGEALYDNVIQLDGVTPKNFRQKILSQVSFNQLKAVYHNKQFSSILQVKVVLPQVIYDKFIPNISHLTLCNLPQVEKRYYPMTAIHNFITSKLILPFNPYLQNNTTAYMSFFQLKQEIGSQIFDIQYQQKIVASYNNLIKSEWLHHDSNLEAISIEDIGTLHSLTKLNLQSFQAIYQSWDCAVKAGERNDFTVCSSWGLKDHKLYLLNVLKLKVDYPTLREVVFKMATLFKVDHLLIEDSAAGAQLIQEIKVKNPILNFVAIKPKLDKITRLTLVSHFFEKGFIILPQSASWLSDFLNEILNFPDTMHDDQVDSVTQFLSWYYNKTKNCNYKFNIL